MTRPQSETNGGAPMPAPDTTKHRLRLDYKGCDGDPWSIFGQGVSIQFAIMELRETLEKDTSEMEESDAAEFYEIIAEAIATPGEPAQRRDFSTPESDFDVTYYPPQTDSKAPATAPDAFPSFSARVVEIMTNYDGADALAEIANLMLTRGLAEEDRDGTLRPIIGKAKEVQS